MKITLLQSDIVALMMNKIGTSTTGTYNRADPTAYAKGSAKFELMYGYSFGKQPGPECSMACVENPCEKCDQADIPTPEVIKASFHDVTWGVEFVFETSVGVLRAYFSRNDFGEKNPDGGKWIARKGTTLKKFKRVFTDILFADPEGTNFVEGKERSDEEKIA